MYRSAEITFGGVLANARTEFHRFLYAVFVSVCVIAENLYMWFTPTCVAMSSGSAVFTSAPRVYNRFGPVIRLPFLNYFKTTITRFYHFIVDYDPQVIEQKEQSRPACLPLSYVLRFITDAARKEGPFLGTSGAELKRKLAIKHHSYSMTSSNRSLSPTGKDA